MSTQAAATIVIILLAFALAALILQSRRALHAAAQQIDAITEDAGRIPAASDNKLGINLALQDECELVYGMPAYEPADPDLDAGCDRLRAAIRDEQQKGESA